MAKRIEPGYGCSPDDPPLWQVCHFGPDEDGDWDTVCLELCGESSEEGRRMAMDGFIDDNEDDVQEELLSWDGDPNGFSELSYNSENTGWWVACTKF